MGYLKVLICKTLSIRGIAKIGNSQDRFIQYIWMVFVLSMSSLLTYATTKLVQEFLNYDLVIRISIKSNDYSTEFPSFSFCHHHPFGSQSKNYWDNNLIMSPTQFNRKIRDSMKNAMDSGNMPAYGIFTQDERRIYYQHLSASDADKLGWDNDTFIICSIYKGSNMEVGLGSSCSMKINKISIPQYFNCFSITPDDSNPNSRVTSITLLIRVSSGMNESLEHQKSFIPGILNQLSGLRGIIHERFTFPDIENEGFHLEPGKLVEINYAVIKKSKISTPKQPCSKTTREKIIDLDKSYLFSQSACFKSSKGWSSLKKCSCFFADTMRTGIPNATHPYCGNILNISFNMLSDRVQCLTSWSLDFNKQIKEIFFNKCKSSCVHFLYDVSLSVTKWLPTNWQLGWLIDIDAANKNSQPNPSTTDENQDIKTDNQDSIKKFENYINSKDLLSYPNNGKFVDKDNFVMIVIKRRNFDTIEHREKLTLDLYNLISRFGGLCSLCLGLTCAFLMEIVEMIYIAIDDSKKKKKDQIKIINCEELENDVQILDKTRSESPIWLSSL